MLTPHRLLHWLILLLPALTLLTISLGAWTRLADAGLGCPDWPGCYDFVLLPSDASEIAIAESRYPDTPYEGEKALLEVTHRYFAAATGILIFVILGLLLAIARKSPHPQYPLRLTALLTLIVCLQGLFGYLTVSLKLWPQVVTIHLLGGMLVLALSWLLLLHTFNNLKRLPRQLTTLAWLGLSLLIAQIALGAWVSSNYAALACPDFPLCQGKWWPPADFSDGFNLARPPETNYLYGQLNSKARTAIHLAHRLGALIVLPTLLLLAWKAMAAGLKYRAGAVIVLLVTQLLLGVLNVVLHLPLVTGLLHNTVAALLLLAVISLLPILPERMPPAS